MATRKPLVIVNGHIQQLPDGDLIAGAGSVGGAVAIRYLFSTTTTDSDPGNGNLRLGNATQNTATVLRLDTLDVNGDDWSTTILDMGNALTGETGYLRLVHATDPTKWILWLAEQVNPETGYYNVFGTIQGSSDTNPFSDGDPVVVHYSKNGVDGDDGLDGDDGAPGGGITISYLFNDATADADPGAGYLAFDNATQNTSTTLRLSDLDALFVDWQAAIATLDDSTNTVKGHIRVQGVANPADWIVFAITGLTDETDYTNVAVTVVASSSANPFTAEDEVTLFFTPAGDGFVISVTDNAILRGDGTTGIQDSLHFIDDEGKHTYQANDSKFFPSYGSQLADATGWTSTGWTGDFNSGFTHTAGNTDALSDDTVVSVGSVYRLSVTISGRTAGGFTMGVGGVSQAAAISVNGTRREIIKADTTAGISIVPQSTFDGTITDITLQLVTASEAVYVLSNASSNVQQEFRAGPGATSFVAIGLDAGRYIDPLDTFASTNSSVCIGPGAGKSLGSGYSNVCIGPNAAQNLSCGQLNVCIGSTAGGSMTSGLQNVCIGNAAGFGITTAANCIYIGQAAGIFATGSNIGIGNSTVQDATGTNNIGIGSSACTDVSTGSNNVGIGLNALLSDTTGGSNTAVGVNAGRSFTSGGFNVCMGSSAGFNASQSATASNCMLLGAGTYGTGSSAVAIGANSNAGGSGIAIGNSASAAANQCVIGAPTQTECQIIGGLTVNDAGGDFDTRIEGDTATNLVYCDASGDSVYIGTTVIGAIAAFSPTGVVFNENAADMDFRVEGVTATQLFRCDAGLDTVFIGTTTAGSMATFHPTAVVFNETGEDRDFRVEGDTATSLFVVDAGTDTVAIGTTSSGVIARFTPSRVFINDGANDTDFTVRSLNVAALLFCDASADSIYVGSSTSFNGIAHLAPTSIVFNEEGADRDFRIEGDTATNLFVCDASVDRVDIGTTSQGTIAQFAQTSIVFNNNTADIDFRVRGDTASQLFVCDAGTDTVQIGTTVVGQIASFASGAIFFNQNAADIDFLVQGDTATQLFRCDAGLDRVDIGTTTQGNIARFSAAGILFNVNNENRDFTVDSVNVNSFFTVDADQDAFFLASTTAANGVAAFRPTNIVMNEGGDDRDFRVEGDTLTHLVFCDASAATENIALLATSEPNWQSMDRGLFVGNVETAPTGNPASGVFVYSEGGELKTRASGGTISTLTSYGVYGYGAGTNYTLTNTMAEIDRGTTDSAITLTQPGTYEIGGRVTINHNNTTYASGNFELKARRTNNTAADVANSFVDVAVVRTAGSNHGVEINLPTVLYTTTNSDDRIALFVRNNVSPSAGSATVTYDAIWAKRIS